METTKIEIPEINSLQDFDAWLWAGVPTEAERQAEINAWIWEAAPPQVPVPAPTVVDC